MGKVGMAITWQIIDRTYSQWFGGYGVKLQGVMENENKSGPKNYLS
jgi:hypothetical protein